MNKKFTKLIAALALLVFMMPSLAGWGQTKDEPTVLFHETFGDNSGSAREWSDTYSVKSGVASVYSGVGSYNVTYAKQSKNTMGQTKSALVSNQGKTGSMVVGPLNVSSYGSLEVSFYFGMSSSSWSNNSFVRLSYSDSNNSNSTFTEVTRTDSNGNPAGAVSNNSNHKQAVYSLPDAAISSTLYLKFEFFCYQMNNQNTAIGQAYFDEINMTGIESSNPTVSIPTDPINVTSAGGTGNLNITYSNLTVTDASNFGCTFYAADGETQLTGNDIPTWVGQTITGNNTNGYQFNYNINAYTGNTDRVARLKVYCIDNDLETEAYSELLTITQTAKHTVNFTLDGGTFVANDDFEESIVEVETGTYHLPSATKEGKTFDGWKDDATNVVYAANAEYEVTSDVSFTAQWSSIASVTYTVASTSSVTTTGSAPIGSTATYSSTYGSNYQLTANNSMTLTLNGYQGRTVKSIVLSMKSNKDSGAGTLSVVAGSTTLASINDNGAGVAFNNSAWNGSWSQSYTNVTPTMTNANYEIQAGENLVITIAATANSLFCESFTINYETTTTEPMVVVSPMEQTISHLAQNITTGDKVFSIFYLNINSPTFVMEYCDENGNVFENQTDPYLWFTASVTNNETVTYTAEANTTDTDRTAYFKVYTMVAGNRVYSGLCSMTQKHLPYTYTLVDGTNVTLEAGKHYIIASSKSNGDANAMGAQSGSVRSCVPVEVSSNQITEVDGLYEIVISGSGTTAEPWTMYSVKDGGYMYATGASSANIGIRADNVTTNPTYGQWTINISSDVATITSKTSEDYNKFMYNSSNPRFACYKSNQASIYLYKRDDDKGLEFYSPTTVSTLSTTNGEIYLVKKDGALTISETSNHAAANLIIEDGGQLITNSTGVQATVKKTIAAHGATTADGGWNFIASPINSNSLDPATIGFSMITDELGDEATVTTATYDLYKFVENPTDNGKEWKNYRNAAFNLANGQGYLYASKGGTTLNFMGFVNSSADVNVNLAYTEGVEFAGWNLVGNPYTFYAFLNKPYYKMNDNGSAILATAQSSDSIAPCTGVMVHVDAAEQNVTFSKNAFRNATTGNLNIAVVQVNERGASTTTIDNAIVSFNEGNELPKFYFMEQNANLYIPQGEKEYAIATSEGQGEMPLNFRANADGQYTLTVNPEGVEMNYLHLIDNMTGNDIDLLQTPSYSFNAKTTDYESRFRLVFAANNESGVSASSTTFAFYSNGNWMVNNEGEATLQVIDVMGRVLSNQTISGTAELSLNQVPGVYVLRLVNGNDVKTQKIVVR